MGVRDRGEDGRKNFGPLLPTMVSRGHLDELCEWERGILERVELVEGNLSCEPARGCC